MILNDWRISVSNDSDLDYRFDLFFGHIIVARSPVYSHISNTLTGLTTLRAFGVEKMFLDQFYKYQNIHSAAYFMSICTARGFGVMVDWVCACYIASVVLVSLFSGEGWYNFSNNLDVNSHF